jgi:quercetin dioxygenase-like cupin family protein
LSDELPVTVRKDQGRPFEALGSPVFRLIHPKTTGSVDLGVSICVMEPGQRVLRHRHDYEEAYYVLRGSGSMYLEGHEPIRLEPDLSVYIAAGRVHGQVNDGDERLEILCSLSTPPVEGEIPEIVEAPGSVEAAE